MNSPVSPAPCHTCPLCGGSNGCQPAQTGSFDGTPCWCTSVTFSKNLLNKVPPALRQKACICRSCAEHAAQASSSENHP